MNAYTTTSQARIQPRDFSAVFRANGLAGASLARLEWQRQCQAEAEVDWLLTSNGVTRQESPSRVALLRQALGTALVRTGEHLAGGPLSNVVPATASVSGTPGPAA